MDAWPVPRSLVGIRASVGRMQADTLRGMERALQALEARRAELLATLEKRAGELAAAFLGRLNVASRSDIADLRAHLGTLERRIQKLATKDAAGGRRAAAG